MVNLVFIIQRSANAVYIIAGAGLLFWGWRLLRAQRRLAQTQFELEREYALSERARYFNLTALCMLLILATIAIAHVVAPYLRAHPLSFTQADPLVFSDQFVTRAPGAATQPVALAIGVTPPPGELAALEMEAGGDAMDAVEGGPTPLPLGGMATDIFFRRGRRDLHALTHAARHHHPRCAAANGMHRSRRGAHVAEERAGAF
ncbi:MAG: hypothetical protein M5R40_23285 [Anaerolineae bacterium]|nr:hypothetical protein [Anaerolineae bacterium]